MLAAFFKITSALVCTVALSFAASNAPVVFGHATVRQAADQTTPNSRTTIGVYEMVTCTLPSGHPAGDWTTTPGAKIIEKTADVLRFRADALGTITINWVPDGVPVTFTVVAPVATDKWMTKVRELPVLPGCVGAAMQLSNFRVGPMNVNFEGVMIREANGPGTLGTGIWTSPNTPAHTTAGGDGADIDGRNLWLLEDTVASGLNLDQDGGIVSIGKPTTAFRVGGVSTGAPIPSGYTWVIPMEYRRSDSSDAWVRFGEVTQTAMVDVAFTTTLTKERVNPCTVTHVLTP